MIDTDKYAEVIDDDGYFCEDRIADLLAEVKRLRDEVGRLKRSNDLAWSLTKEAGEYE